MAPVMGTVEHAEARLRRVWALGLGLLFAVLPAWSLAAQEAGSPSVAEPVGLTAASSPARLAERSFQLWFAGERVGGLRQVRREHPIHGRELYREIRLIEAGAVLHLSEVRGKQERKCVWRERASYDQIRSGPRPRSVLIHQRGTEPIEQVRYGSGARLSRQWEPEPGASWAGPQEWLEVWAAGAPSGSGRLWNPRAGSLEAFSWRVSVLGLGPLCPGPAGWRAVTLRDATGREGATWWFLGGVWLGGRMQPGGLWVLPGELSKVPLPG